MRHSTGSSLVQVNACRLFGTKPLPEAVLVYCQFESWEQVSVKFGLEFYHFHTKKCIWKCNPPKLRPFCPGGDELRFQIHWSVAYHWNQRSIKMPTLSSLTAPRVDIMTPCRVACDAKGGIIPSIGFQWQNHELYLSIWKVNFYSKTLVVIMSVRTRPLFCSSCNSA